MKIVGFCSGVEKLTDGNMIKGIKVYYTEALPPQSDKLSYGNFVAVAFFPDQRSDLRPQIDVKELTYYVDNQTDLEIFFDRFGRNPRLFPSDGAGAF